MLIKTPASMPQYVYVNRRYFNTISLFHAREGLGKRRTGTRQGLYYSSWWYVVCTVMEVICIQKYHRLCAHSMPLCKVRVMVSVMSLICRSHQLQLQQNNFQYFLFLVSRLADHFGGKLHMGFIKIRDRLKELQVLPVVSRARSLVNHTGLRLLTISFLHTQCWRTSEAIPTYQT